MFVDSVHASVARKSTMINDEDTLHSVSVLE
jgi:hypothetical protein